MNPLQTSKSKFCCYFHPLIDFITFLVINPVVQSGHLLVNFKVILFGITNATTRLFVGE